MRRRLALLSLAVAAACAVSTPAAHAYPVCARVITESRLPDDPDTGQTCLGWEYGVLCHAHHYWDGDLKVEVWVYYCIPRVWP